jgi:hypothetical protein
MRTWGSDFLVVHGLVVLRAIYSDRCLDDGLHRASKEMQPYWCQGPIILRELDVTAKIRRGQNAADMERPMGIDPVTQS